MDFLDFYWLLDLKDDNQIPYFELFSEIIWIEDHIDDLWLKDIVVQMKFLILMMEKLIKTGNTKSIKNIENALE